MPALIMTLDKITILYASPKADTFLSKYQHGGRSNYSTNTAKLNLIYAAKTKGFKYSLLLDLSKAFDKVNREKLKTIIIISLRKVLIQKTRQIYTRKILNMLRKK